MTYELIFGVVVIGSVLYVIGAFIFIAWLDHEDAKREAEQRRYWETIHRTPPSPRAPGFPSKRVG